MTKTLALGLVVFALVASYGDACHSAFRSARGAVLGVDTLGPAEFAPYDICEGRGWGGLTIASGTGPPRDFSLDYVTRIIEPPGVTCLFDTCGWTHGQAVFGRFEMTGPDISLAGSVQYFGSAWQAVGEVFGNPAVFSYVGP